MTTIPLLPIIDFPVYTSDYTGRINRLQHSETTLGIRFQACHQVSGTGKFPNLPPSFDY